MSTKKQLNKVHMEFDPRGFSQKVKDVILARAAQWDCSPQEAMRRILESHARRKELAPV